MVEWERRYQGLVEYFARGCWIAFFFRHTANIRSAYMITLLSAQGEGNRRILGDFFDDLLLYLYASAGAASL